MKRNLQGLATGEVLVPTGLRSRVRDGDNPEKAGTVAVAVG